MGNVLLVSDIVEENGKTVRENNNALIHNIPLGSLVEILPDMWEMESGEVSISTGLRLYVVNHGRDCNGTPLYDLSFDPDAHVQWANYKKIIDEKSYDPEDEYSEAITKARYWSYSGAIKSGYPEESLKVIR